MHTSQRVKGYHNPSGLAACILVAQEYRQLSRLELKRSHDRQKLAGGLRGGIDATNALRVIDVHTVYSAQPIYTLSHAIASSSKVKKLRIGK